MCWPCVLGIQTFPTCGCRTANKDWRKCWLKQRGNGQEMAVQVFTGLHCDFKCFGSGGQKKQGNKRPRGKISLGLRCAISSAFNSRCVAWLSLDYFTHLPTPSGDIPRSSSDVILMAFQAVQNQRRLHPRKLT